MKMAEINFLCVHKKLRTKKLAPLLIKEITRRVNLKKIWRAVYTAGVVVPSPFTTSTYHHRNLNPKKLVEVGFTALPKNYPMAKFIKKYQLDEEKEHELKGCVRPFEAKDAKKAFRLFQEHLAEHKFH